MGAPPLFHQLPINVRKQIFELTLAHDEEFKLVSGGAGGHELVKGGLKSGHAPVAHHNNRRNSGHRGHYHDSRIRKWIPAANDLIVTLLGTNRQTRAETAPILYGMNKFEFRDTRILERFLSQIGDMKDYLRVVAVSLFGWPGHARYDCLFLNAASEAAKRAERRMSAAHRAMIALASVKGLETFEVSHGDVCRRYIRNEKHDYDGLREERLNRKEKLEKKRFARDRIRIRYGDDNGQRVATTKTKSRHEESEHLFEPALSLDTLVEATQPLLAALYKARRVTNSTKNVLDVLKIAVHCKGSASHGSTRNGHHKFLYRFGQEDKGHVTPSMRCACSDRRADVEYVCHDLHSEGERRQVHAKNDELMAELRKKVAVSLGLRHE